MLKLPAVIVPSSNYAAGRRADAGLKPRRGFALMALGLLAAFAGPALAHDFWLQPADFRVAPGQTTPVSIQVGHGQSRQRWAVKSDRVLMMRQIGPSGVIDQRDALRRAGTGDLPLRFATPGVHVLALQTNHAQSDLPALRFNDYLKEEGLTPAAALRARQGKTGAPGREIYSRRAKTLVLVGANDAASNALVTKPVGLTLEIVPERNPYSLKPGQALPVQVLYDGRPLAGATVKLTNLDFDMKPVAVKLTDKAGRAAFDVPLTGVWLLNVIWTKPITGDLRGDFDTTFSGLSFGFK